jgi:hypothetical protein
MVEATLMSTTFLIILAVSIPTVIYYKFFKPKDEETDK